MSATVNAYREFTAEQRKKLAEEGKALSDGSYPIETVEDVKNAIQAVGRAKDPEAARAHIKKRAADLGVEDLIPDDWAAAATTFRSDFSAAELALGEWFVARRKKKAKAECADCDDDGVIAIETDDYARILESSDIEGTVAACDAMFQTAVAQLSRAAGVSPTGADGVATGTLSAASLLTMTPKLESQTDSGAAAVASWSSPSTSSVATAVGEAAGRLGAALAVLRTRWSGTTGTQNVLGPQLDAETLSADGASMMRATTDFCAAVARYAVSQQGVPNDGTPLTTATSATSSAAFSAEDATRLSGSLGMIQSDFARLQTTLSATVAQYRAPDYIGMTDEPGENWVEQEGGLPSYIKRIANHLIGKGMTEGHAIASAVNTVKRWARGGRVSEHGGGNRGAAHVKPDTIAKAIVALAEWLAKIAAAHAHSAEVMSFAAATTEDVKKAEEDVPPVDVNDTRSALDEGFKFLTEWVGDEANADDPVMGMVKEALDKVGGILDDLDGKKGGKDKAMAASTATFASAAEQATPKAAEDADPAETAPAAAENADPADTAPEAVDGDDPGEDVPLEKAKADSDALAASADSIVAELTAEYNAAQAALTSPE